MQPLRAVIVGALLALAACAPTMQLAPYSLSAVAQARFEDEVFVSFDGARLPLNRWEPNGDTPPSAVVLALHGINSSAPVFAPLAEYLTARGIAVYAYDARGFGRAPHRGYWAGGDLLSKDVKTAVALLRARYPNAEIGLLGGSLGAAQAVVASTGADAPKIDRLILVAPGVMGWDFLPPGMAVMLRAAVVAAPWARLSPSPDMEAASPVTDNPATIAANAVDPLRIRETRVDVLAGAVDLMEEARGKLGQIRAPVAFLYGERDFLIGPRALQTAAMRLPPGAKVAAYPEGYHLLLRDLQAPRVYEDIVAFLRDPEAPLPSQQSAPASVDNAER